MIETVLVKKLDFNPTFMLRFITRNIYVGKEISLHNVMQLIVIHFVDIILNLSLWLQH